MNESDDLQANSTEALRAMEGVLNGVRSIVRALRMNTREIESKIGMSLAQLFVLQTLAERPAGSLNEIAARTATHQSSVSVVVRRLVEKGYVTRTRSNLDQRRIDLAVTMNGRAILSGAPVMVQTRMLTELRRMPVDELVAFSNQFQRWLEGAGIDQSIAPMLGETETDEGAA